MANVPSYLSKDGSTLLVNIIRSPRLEGKAKLHWVRKLLDSKADVNFKDKVKATQAFLCGNIFESSRTLLLVGRDGAAPHSCGARRSWRDPSPLARRRRLHFHRRGSNCSYLHLGSTRTSLTPFLSGLRFGRCMFVIRRRPQIQRNEWSQRKCPQCRLFAL